MNIITDTLNNFVSSAGLLISGYLPKFIAGLLIIFIGLVIASLLKDIIKIIFRYFHIEKWLETAGIVKKEDVQVWPNLLAELVRWTVIFLFLTSAVETWGVPKVGDVLNQLLIFLPNVFVAVVIGWIGLVTAKLLSDVVRHSLRGLGSKEAMILGNVARYSVIFFTALIILSQLGVAADLVKILFTGIVAMLSLAFGLAFGLGGRDHADKIIAGIIKKIDESSLSKSKK
ncbi:hypothetical protein M1271_05660 [Patescibacteria group bacterium]|nr:hypothetical protein [Patescibacteria group bacterium]MCL5797734.1 hypothetical protein [Patescibacteria group bacterium]